MEGECVGEAHLLVRESSYEYSDFALVGKNKVVQSLLQIGQFRDRCISHGSVGKKENDHVNLI